MTTDKGLVKAYGGLSKKIKQRITELNSAENLDTLKQLPVLRLHEHVGKGKGSWSIDIQKNWRILFTIQHNPIPTLEAGGVDLKQITHIKITSIEDPH